MKIALDAMGGDFGPPNLVSGAVMALQEFPQISKLFLVGDTARIEAELTKHRCSDGRIEVVHSTQVVDMCDKAVDAVRRKKDSSISRAVDLVKQGAADAVVSAGHTGAAVAAATIKLRTLPGIDRPGIAALIPTETNLFVLIDAGANTDCDPVNLLQYAIMGSVYSRHVLGFENPRVGLMSIGNEDVKGTDLTKETFKLLKTSGLTFRGNVEGHDLFEDPVEVVVCDGFVGNVILKTCESISSAIFHWLKHELKKNPVRLAGAMMAKGAFKAIHKKTNWEDYGGSPLLGANGICIIAHGASTPLAIKNALRVAAESIEHHVNPHIIEELQRYNETTTAAPLGPRSARTQQTASIIGTGSYAPEKILSNADLSRIVDTSDEWITTRTGIKERRVAAKDELTSDMASKAAMRALEQAKIAASDVDLILVATATPDMVFPATACFVQQKIGATKAACLDVSAACAGFLFAIEIAQQFITSRTYETVLVIGADKLTAITNWTDRNTCVLFGDGAGAAVLGHRGSAHGVISTYMGSDGGFSNILFMPGGGTKTPITKENAHLHLQTIHMSGKEVYKQAVTAMLAAAKKAIDQAGLSVEDIDCLIPHQANLRIIEAVGERLGIPREKVFVNVDRYGNTSAASVGIALDEANRSGRIKRGDYVLLVVFGGGLTWASTIIEW